MGKYGNGFLSEDENSEFSKVEKNIREKYSTAFDLIYRLNIFCHNQIEIFIKQDIDDVQKRLCTTFFLKILELFQGILILLKKGMLPEARILLRCMIEPFCFLLKVKKDEKFIDIYNMQGVIGKKRLLIVAEELNIDPKYLRNIDISEELRKIRQQIKEQNIKELKIIELLKGSEFNLPFLRLAYSITSQAIHSTPMELENIYFPNNDFRYGPSEENISLLVSSSLLIMLASLTNMNDLFNLGLNKELNDFLDEINPLIT